MRLFRFKDDKYSDIEEITLDDIDLQNRRTLFVFPGAENQSPAFPPASSADEQSIGRMKRLLERGVFYTQTAQIAQKKLDEPYQVVLATWDSYPECMKRLEYMRDKPSTFISDEAKQFTAALYAKGFDANKMTILGWSYGTCFAHEMANDIRLNRLKEGEKLPPIYVVGVATVTNPANSSINGFPGFYMYAYNDTVLTKYIDAETKRFYNSIMSAMEHHIGYNNYILKPIDRHDQISLVMTAPNHPLRRKHSPLKHEEMEAALENPILYEPRRYKEDVQYTLTGKKHKKGGRLFDDDDPERVGMCDTCHMPGVFMDAMDGSKYIPNRKTTSGVSAWEHTLFFDRCLRNALCRDKAIDFQDMLFKHTFCEHTGFNGKSPGMISAMINNRTAIYLPQIDSEGRIQPRGKLSPDTLLKRMQELNPGFIIDGSLKLEEGEVMKTDLRQPELLKHHQAEFDRQKKLASEALSKEGKIIDPAARPEYHILSIDGCYAGSATGFYQFAIDFPSIPDPALSHVAEITPTGAVNHK